MRYKTSMNILLVCCSISIILLFACAGPQVKSEGEREVVERSDDAKPKWVTKKVPKPEAGKIFFRGARTRSTTYEDGMTDARMDAIKGIAQMAQTELYSDYEKARAEFGAPKDDKDIGTVIKEGINAFSETVVNGVIEEDTYYEKYKEYASGKVSYFYDVYLLVSISDKAFKDAANSILEKQKEKARAEKNTKAEDFLDKMRDRIEKKRFSTEGEQ